MYCQRIFQQIYHLVRNCEETKDLTRAIFRKRFQALPRVKEPFLLG